jgi:uncharacterized membrane protein YqjE
MSEERRPTGDLLVLIFGITLCALIVLAGITALMLLIFRPDVDTTTRLVSAVATALNTVVGLLAGFLAGRHTPKRRNGS